jgi:hypothetical protein
MEQIVLSKDRIKKLIQIYEHFKDIQNFTVTVNGNSATVDFDLNELNNIENNFKPLVYK